VFRIKYDGSNFATLYCFPSSGDESEGNPQGGLVIDASNNLYGTTQQGGQYGDGMVFTLPAP